MHIKLVESSSEIRKVHELANSIFGSYFPSIIGEEQTGYMLNKFHSKQAIKQNIKEGQQYYLISNEEEYVGFLCLHIRPAYVYISKLYIKEDCRGKGYSKSVLNIVKYLANKGNHKSLRLNVNKHNELAISVYEKLGFSRIKDEIIDIGHGYVMDDYVYEYIIK